MQKGPNEEKRQQKAEFFVTSIRRTDLAIPLPPSPSPASVRGGLRRRNEDGGRRSICLVLRSVSRNMFSYRVSSNGAKAGKCSLAVTLICITASVKKGSRPNHGAAQVHSSDNSLVQLKLVRKKATALVTPSCADSERREKKSPRGARVRACSRLRNPQADNSSVPKDSG